jgi:thiaminase/transcriptional activator TenA
VAPSPYPGDLYNRLRAASADDWRAYTEHAFVRGLADGSLPEAAFKHYLLQDYLFLIHFARAYALAAYKAEDLDQIRHAAAGLSAIADTEMGLHVTFSARWGLTEADMRAVPEDPRCMAYTRYVLEKGVSGDLLDLHVALTPCMAGYGEIGRRLAADPATRRDGNPYWPWIEMYASDDYQQAAEAETAMLDALFESRAGAGRIAALERTFNEATRLEVGFWQMGLDALSA